MRPRRSSRIFRDEPTGTAGERTPHAGRQNPAPAPARAIHVIPRRALTALLLALTACAPATEPSSASGSAVASPAGSHAAPSDLPSEDSALEALLPDQIGGEPTEKLSLRGDGLVASGSADPSFAEFVERLDAQPEDVGVAYAYTLESEVQAFAYQVIGADPGRLIEELEASVRAQDEASDVTWSDATLGDRQVRRGTAAEATDASIYLYGARDIVFLIVTDDKALATEVVAGLP